MSKLTGELKLFKEIWEEREHVSQLTGRPLKYFNVAYFAHIIAKSKWSDGRLMKENIILLHPEEHNLLDQGTEKQRAEYSEKWRCDWNFIESIKENLYERYRRNRKDE